MRTAVIALGAAIGLALAIVLGVAMYLRPKSPAFRMIGQDPDAVAIMGTAEWAGSSPASLSEVFAQLSQLDSDNFGSYRLVQIYAKLREEHLGYLRVDRARGLRSREPLSERKYITVGGDPWSWTVGDLTLDLHTIRLDYKSPRLLFFPKERGETSALAKFARAAGERVGLRTFNASVNPGRRTYSVFCVVSPEKTECWQQGIAETRGLVVRIP